MHNLAVCKIYRYKNLYNAAKPGARATRNTSLPEAATAAQAPRPRIAAGVQAARRRPVYFPRRLVPAAPHPGVQAARRTAGDRNANIEKIFADFIVEFFVEFFIQSVIEPVIKFIIIRSPLPPQIQSRRTRPEVTHI